jgi:hypothetical protein
VSVLSPWVKLVDGVVPGEFATEVTDHWGPAARRAGPPATVAFDVVNLAAAAREAAPLPARAIPVCCGVPLAIPK